MLNLDREGFELDVAKRLYMLYIYDEWHHADGAWEPIEDCLKRNAHIFAVDYKEPHYGDCINKAVTCMTCVREDFLEKARALIKTQGDAMSDMLDKLALDA